MTTRLESVLALLFSGTLAAACGGGGHDVDPRVIPGGGVGDADIDGEVNIYVLDDVTGDPVEGAAVHVGDTVTGETDADGLFVASDDSLSGPQDITVIASTYTSSTWYGAAGANVTVPLSLTEPSTDVPQATVTGTINGWAALTPPQGSAVIAFVGYSANNDDDDPANGIEQPTGNPAPNACIKTANEACNWSLITRTGPQMIYALIGTFDLTTQAIAINSIAYLSDVTVADGVDQDGLALDILDSNDLETPDVSTPTAPAGTDTVSAFARLNLGDDGRLQLPLTGAIIVPAPKTSVFAGSTYDLVGVATSDTNADAQSVRIDRGLDTLDGASLGALMALPGNVSTDGTDFSFDRVTGASLHIFAVQAPDGLDAWGAVVLDDRTVVTRPEAIVLPDGSLTVIAQALELPDLDVEDFAIDDIIDTVARVSADGATFTN
jgi:hypothetical protein